METSAASIVRFRGPRWYVVQSRPIQEEVAATHLERQGFPIFLPRIVRSLGSPSRARRVLRPLFPRYLFVALDLEVDRWRPVRGTYGVSALVMDGDRPRAVPPGLVEELRARVGADGGVVLRGQLAPGDRVRFDNGPLVGQTGSLLELSAPDRVSVLFQMLGAERVVVVGADDLIRIPA